MLSIMFRDIFCPIMLDDMSWPIILLLSMSWFIMLELPFVYILWPILLPMTFSFIILWPIIFPIILSLNISILLEVPIMPYKLGLEDISFIWFPSIMVFDRPLLK